MEEVLNYLKNQLILNQQRKAINEERIKELEDMIGTLERKKPTPESVSSKN